MKFELYRRIDLIVFGVLMIFSSLASLFIFSNHSFQFYISFTNLILFIVIVRWNYLGLLPYLINQIILSIVQVNSFAAEPLLAFGVNLFGCLFLPFLCFIMSKYIKNVRTHPILLCTLFCMTFVLIGIGRAFGMFLVQDFNLWNNFKVYVINQEFFSMVIGLVLLLLLKNIDNLVVNVKDYLEKVQEEAKREEDNNGRIQKQKLHRNDIEKD